MTCCDVCLRPLPASDSGLCETCYQDWLDYQQSKSDDDGDDDA